MRQWFALLFTLKGKLIDQHSLDSIERIASEALLVNVVNHGVVLGLHCARLAWSAQGDLNIAALQRLADYMLSPAQDERDLVCGFDFAG